MQKCKKTCFIYLIFLDVLHHNLSRSICLSGDKFQPHMMYVVETRFKSPYGRKKKSWTTSLGLNKNQHKLEWMIATDMCVDGALIGNGRTRRVRQMCAKDKPKAMGHISLREPPHGMKY